MPKSMLGSLPLRVLCGPGGTLLESLAGADGPFVLEELSRFNRREPCWIPESIGMITLAQARAIGKIEPIPGLMAPKEGLAYQTTVVVDWDMPWSEFQSENLPDTEEDSSVLRADVASQYSSLKNGLTLEKVYLVCFEQFCDRADLAIECATRAGLTPAHGRIPAAVMGACRSIVEQINKQRPRGSSAVAIVTASERKFEFDQHPRYPGAICERGLMRGYLGSSWSGQCATQLWTFSRRPKA